MSDIQSTSRMVGMAFIIMLAGAADLRADTVFLKDGGEVEGKVVSESKFSVVVKSANGRMHSIRRTNIEVIVYEEEAAPVRPVIVGQAHKAPASEKDGVAGEKKEQGKEKVEGDGDPKGKGEAGKGGEAGKDPSSKDGKGKDEIAKDEKPVWPVLAPELLAKVKVQMALLESDNPAERGRAKSALVGLGKDIIPEMILGLNHKDERVRVACCDVLGSLNARNAVKFLIETLYAVLPEKGNAAAYHRGYIRSLKTTLASTSGQAFINVEPNSAFVQDGLLKYIEWYEVNYDRLPPQVGEVEVDPTDPDYVKKLKDARKLVLKKRTWPRPPMSADQALGGKQEVPKGAGERKVDTEYKERFPTTDRETSGGYIREADQQYAEDFFR